MVAYTGESGGKRWVMGVDYSERTGGCAEVGTIYMSDRTKA